jgi:hypothetical protein
LEISVTKKDQTAQITFRNKSDLSFRLKSMPHDSRLVYLRNTDIETVTIAPQGVFTISIRLNNGIAGGDINFSVENLMVEPNKGMIYNVKI